MTSRHSNNELSQKYDSNIQNQCYVDMVTILYVRSWKLREAIYQYREPQAEESCSWSVGMLQYCYKPCCNGEPMLCRICISGWVLALVLMNEVAIVFQVLTYIANCWNSKNWLGAKPDYMIGLIAETLQILNPALAVYIKPLSFKTKGHYNAVSLYLVNVAELMNGTYNSDTPTHQYYPESIGTGGLSANCELRSFGSYLQG